MMRRLKYESLGAHLLQVSKHRHSVEEFLSFFLPVIGKEAVAEDKPPPLVPF